MKRRSGREWAARTALAALVVVLGYSSVAHSLAQALVRTNTARAHRLAPHDGRITARLAASLIEGSPSAADFQRADAVAQEALKQDPTAVTAVATRGFAAGVRGDIAQARRWFAYAQTLSRRELRTQLWGIEDAVRRGDIAGALRHYDIALRTNSSSWALLFPILASATADPSIRVELARTLSSRPNWGNDFVSYLAGNSTDPRSTAQLFMQLRGTGVSVPDTARAAIINGLIGDGKAEDAWHYYASEHAGADRRMSRDPRFANNSNVVSLLDWNLVNDAGPTASIQAGDTGGMFSFAAPAGVGGTLLRQLQLLPSGIYQIRGHSSGIDQEEQARPYWVLRCRQTEQELGRVVMPNSDQGNGRFAGTFTVPAGCQVQTLEFVARASDAVGGATGEIDWVELRPAR